MMKNILDIVSKFFLFLFVVFVFSFALNLSVLNVFALGDNSVSINDARGWLDDGFPWNSTDPPEEEPITEPSTEEETEQATELETEEPTEEPIEKYTTIQNQSSFTNVLLIMIFVVLVITLFNRYV